MSNKIVNKIELQITSTHRPLPRRAQLQRWVDHVLNQQLHTYCHASEGWHDRHFRIGIRIVDEPEMAKLNKRYRGKEGPTNVLSFPYDMPPLPRQKYPPLGDLVLCAPVIEREALEQGKTIEEHWAHMVIHGILHLLNYDHVKKNEAHIMEALEIKLMADLHYPNPYFS